jgi:hypothetical protein
MSYNTYIYPVYPVTMTTEVKEPKNVLIKKSIIRYPHIYRFMKLKPLKVWKSLNLTKILRKQKFWKLNLK